MFHLVNDTKETCIPAYLVTVIVLLIVESSTIKYT